jgi:hypothetical protein
MIDFSSASNNRNLTAVQVESGANYHRPESLSSASATVDKASIILLFGLTSAPHQATAYALSPLLLTGSRERVYTFCQDRAVAGEHMTDDFGLVSIRKRGLLKRHWPSFQSRSVFERASTKERAARAADRQIRILIPAADMPRSLTLPTGGT